MKPGIIINGEEVSREEALELLNNKDSVVQDFAFTFVNKKKDSPLTHDGFQLDKEFISELSKARERMKANNIKLWVEASPHIMGNDMLLCMYQANDLTPRQKRILKIFRKGF